MFIVAFAEEVAVILMPRHVVSSDNSCYSFVNSTAVNEAAFLCGSSWRSQRASRGQHYFQVWLRSQRASRDQQYFQVWLRSQRASRSQQYFQVWPRSQRASRGQQYCQVWLRSQRVSRSQQYFQVLLSCCCLWVENVEGTVAVCSWLSCSDDFSSLFCCCFFVLCLVQWSWSCTVQ